MEIESDYVRTFYNLTAANLQQAPVLLSELITLMEQAVQGEERGHVCVYVCVRDRVCVLISQHLQELAWAKSNTHTLFPKTLLPLNTVRK